MAVNGSELAQFLEALAKLSVLKVSPRPKNNETRRRLGFSIDQVIECALGVTHAECVDGPLEDSKHGGKLCVFKKRVKSYLIYIKINVDVELIISFHIDED